VISNDSNNNNNFSSGNAKCVGGGTLGLGSSGQMYHFDVI